MRQCYYRTVNLQVLYVSATSYALKCAIETMGSYDLILCGKQTTDGDTAQVGPEIAEQLGLEHAANVYRILDLNEKKITVMLNLEDYFQTQSMKLPCLLTIEKDANTPRLPSYRRKCGVKSDQVRVLSASDLVNMEEGRCGLKGSPTQVECIFPPEKNEDRQSFEGTGEELAQAAVKILSERRFL